MSLPSRPASPQRQTEPERKGILMCGMKAGSGRGGKGWGGIWVKGFSRSAAGLAAGWRGFKLIWRSELGGCAYWAGWGRVDGLSTGLAGMMTAGRIPLGVGDGAAEGSRWFKAARRRLGRARRERWSMQGGAVICLPDDRGGRGAGWGGRTQQLSFPGYLFLL